MTLRTLGLAGATVLSAELLGKVELEVDDSKTQTILSVYNNFLLSCVNCSNLQEGSSRRKRAADAVQQNSIIGLDVDIMVAAAPADTNNSIPAIVDEAIQTYLTVGHFISVFPKIKGYSLHQVEHSRSKAKTVRQRWPTR